MIEFSHFCCPQCLALGNAFCSGFSWRWRVLGWDLLGDFPKLITRRKGQTCGREDYLTVYSRVWFFPCRCGLKVESSTFSQFELTAFGKIYFQRGKNAEIILSPWISFKNVLRRNLGTFSHWEMQITWCGEQRGIGRFMCLAIQSSRLGSRNSYRVSRNLKSWKAFGKPADIPSSQGHHRVSIRCSQFRIIPSMSWFAEV